jgi:putative hydrolase of the HAD superfamily
MYESARSSIKPEEDAIDVGSVVKSEVRVISFDLDNTLWNTTETIAVANDALAEFLSSRNISQPIRVEKVMGDLFRADKARYCPIEKEEAKVPVSLTLLRKEAIQRVLEDYNDFSPEDAKAFADEAFEEWARARHEAIPRHFASSVKECLQELTEIRTSTGHPVLIGAITDGNSDPSKISALAGFFDFFINAEKIGVGKPDKRLYLKGAQQALSHPALSDLTASIDTMSDEDVEELLGPFWVHIGDDFAKDVVAAKSLKMRTIWSRELVLERNPVTQKLEASKNSRTVEEFVKELSGMKVVKMEVGADDYLAESLQREFADAIVDQFSELINIIKEWHSEASIGESDLVNESTAPEMLSDSAMNPVFQTNADSATTTVGEKQQTDKKFCMFCGESLPSVAKFCSSCGEKQEV